MEYHSDRFLDYSLLVYDEKKLIAAVPANFFDKILISHQGLSYGGIVLHDQVRLAETAAVVKAVMEYLYSHDIPLWVIKIIPRMYHTRPSDDLDWILFKLNAKLTRRDTALAVDNLAARLPYQERRKRSIKKAFNCNIEIKNGFTEIAPFWTDVLIPNLMSKHGTAPVHTIEEIELLASRFPKNIVQHTIYLDGVIVAGTTMFLNNDVAHAQYISGTELGRNAGCLDFLFDHIIREEYKEYRYFDFGICNENGGLFINKGLLDWKEGFGARTISHDFYEMKTSNYALLDNIYNA